MKGSGMQSFTSWAVVDTMSSNIPKADDDVRSLSESMSK